MNARPPKSRAATELLHRVGNSCCEREETIVVEHQEQRVGVVGRIGRNRNRSVSILSACGNPSSGSISEATVVRAGGPLTTIEPGTAAASESAWPMCRASAATVGPLPLTIAPSAPASRERVERLGHLGVVSDDAGLQVVEDRVAEQLDVAGLERRDQHAGVEPATGASSHQP